MTALIWIGSFIFITIINALIGELSGFKAGVVIVYLVWFWLAKKMVSFYKQHRDKNNFEYICQYIPEELKKECEKLRCNKKDLKIYLRSCIEKKDISKSYARILYREFKKGKQQPNSEETKNEACIFNGVLYCRKCGERLLDEARFCNKCGTKIIELPEENNKETQ